MPENTEKDYNPTEKKFPWVSVEEFHRHYSRAMLDYLNSVNHPKWGNQHIGDLSASAENFSEVWWHIFANFHEYYRQDDE